MKRRQNHSCDQCRRSKKACDGFVINDAQRRYTQVFTLGSQSHVQPEIQPCTYCVRTKKQCTLNPHWGQPDAQATAAVAAAAAAMPTSPAETIAGHWKSANGKRRRADWSGHTGMDLDITDALQFLHSPGGIPFSWVNQGSQDNDMRHLSASSDSLEGDADVSNQGDQYQQQHHHHHFEYETPYLFNDDLLPSDEASFQGLDKPSSPSQPDDMAHPSSTWGPSPALTGTVDSSSSSSSMHAAKLRRASQQLRVRARTLPPPLQTDMSYSIMARSNNYLITEGLLRIYHDVLENNLACWITEDTCPYLMRRQDAMQPRARIELELPGAKLGGTQPQPEWGSAWSNRMYRRVQQLDRVAQASGLIRLTNAQNKAASKALDLVIMAFATQWSQGTRRYESFPSTPAEANDPSHFHGLAKILDGGFEQHLQQCLWEQAKKALDGVAGLECYRVVYAELVFGFTSRPFVDEDGLEAIAEDTTAPIWSQVTDMLAQDGPPACLERAARKIQAMRFNFDASEKGLDPKNRDKESSRTQSLDCRLNSEERGTVGLLFWFAVMLDTVSSSMNERPVTVADEDCEHDEVPAKVARCAASSNANRLVHRRWDLDLYAQEDSSQPRILQWPCSYEAAANAVARSAAVKVLLFRYVSYLQSALRKGQSGQAIEEIIQDATSVYRYWNRTHGAFFRGFIRDYDSLPSRFKSWFPCIAVPWHLGSLMLADLISFVDKNGLGSKEAGQGRLRAKMAQKIRKASAADLSDLARVTTPSVDNMPSEQLADCHFAVNEGALLTEPWSELLIRAFAKAAVFYLEEADEQQRHEWSALGHDDELQVSLRRGEECLRALWFLGRKSETARTVTKVLARGLQERKKDHAATATPNLVVSAY